MPLWPHLRCLSLLRNDDRSLVRNDDWIERWFSQAAVLFPSLTSLSTSTCSDEAIRSLVHLPRLEELRFTDYREDDTEERVLTTVKGFRAFGRAASLRSLVYSPREGGECKTPSLASLTAMFTLSGLVRLTLTAGWLTKAKCRELFTQHRYVHLRCLQLIAQYGSGCYVCPQTEASLRPLVKPAVFLVPGRATICSAKIAVVRRDASLVQ